MIEHYPLILASYLLDFSYTNFFNIESRVFVNFPLINTPYIDKQSPNRLEFCFEMNRVYKLNDPHSFPRVTVDIVDNVEHCNTYQSMVNYQDKIYNDNLQLFIQDYSTQDSLYTDFNNKLVVFLEDHIALYMDEYKKVVSAKRLDNQASLYDQEKLKMTQFCNDIKKVFHHIYNNTLFSEYIEKTNKNFIYVDADSMSDTQNLISFIQSFKLNTKLKNKLEEKDIYTKKHKL